MENENSEELTKKERNELKRKENQSAREKEIKIKKIKSMAPWIILIVLVGLAIYWIAMAAEKSSLDRPGESISILNRDHISVGDAHEEYNSNPPTSGPHAGPAGWGFSEDEILDENAIHNLEHGGIWISYKNLNDDSVSTLKEIAKRNSLSVIVSPREANDANVVLSSWGRLLELDTVDEELIAEFIRKNKNKSPEPLAR